MAMSAELAMTAGASDSVHANLDALAPSVAARLAGSSSRQSSRPLSLRALADEIRRIEGGFGNPHQRRHIPTGIAPLDQQLPAAGLAAGALHELIATAPGGALRLWALWLARQSIMTNEYIIWLDDAGDVYPPAVWAWGIDPARLVLVRPGNRKDSFWALDQSLRCRGIAAVIASPGNLTRAQARRLQLAAETGGGIGLLLKESDRRSAASRSASLSNGIAHPDSVEGHHASLSPIGLASRWHIAPVSTAHDPSTSEARHGINPPSDISKRSEDSLWRTNPQWTQRFTVEVVRCRGGGPLAPVLLEVDRETGLVPVSPELADRPRQATAQSPPRRTGTFAA